MNIISVIVPAYNVEKYISECLNSLLCQTIGNIEIVIVDDGSTDGTPQICDQYAVRYANVSVIHKENGGVSSARNEGLKLAKGEYIGFVDADDVVDANMYLTLYEALVKNDADIAMCNYRKIDSIGNYVSSSIFVDDTVVCGDEVLSWINRENGWRCVLVMPKLYKRVLFDEVLFPEGRIHEDEYVAHQLFHRSKAVASVSAILYSYRNAEDSIMTGRITVKRLDAVDAIFRRYVDYECWGYKYLLKGTLECSKNSLSMLPRIQPISKKEKAYIAQIISEYRYMVKHTGWKAGLINVLIALNPKMYYMIRNRIRRR